MALHGIIFFLSLLGEINSPHYGACFCSTLPSPLLCLLQLKNEKNPADIREVREEDENEDNTKKSKGFFALQQFNFIFLYGRAKGVT